MHPVYNLEYKVRDKLGRTKKSVHVGVFNDLDKLEVAKVQVSKSNPGVTFDVYQSNHNIFDVPPEFV